MLQQIEETDLVIKQTKEIVLTKELVDALYAEHAQSDHAESDQAESEHAESDTFKTICTQMMRFVLMQLSV